MSLRAFIRTSWGWTRYAWNVTGISLLLLLVAEGSCRVASHVHRRLDPPAGRSAPGYEILSRQPWGPQYVQDVAGYHWRNRFEPFVEFRPLPLSSESINISEAGLRTTPHNDASHERNETIFLFGGSTMLGVGVPDWGTIAAYLSLRYRQEGLPHEVVNYATCWWTSSQSLAQLMVLLRQGKRPKVVVFYDGINDVNVVSYGGTVGEISPEADAILRRGFKDEPSVTRGVLANSLLLRMLLNRIRPDLRSKGLGRFTLSEAEIELGARQIVQAYENNVRMVVALGREMGFTPFLFFQPAPLIARKPMTESDTQATSDRRQSRASETMLYARVYALIQGSEALRGCPVFHDLQDIFAAEGRPMYADSEHLLPEGNEVVAAAMYERIRNGAAAAPGLADEVDESK